jgi:formiminoglutamate deiminase
VPVRLRCEWAWLGGPQARPDVLLVVEGDRIVGVGMGDTGAAEAPGPGGGDVERLSGLTIPGLVNAHSHAFHRALRSRTQAGTGSFWTWRDQMYRLAATLTPDSYQRLAAATFAEMALAGITTVGEFHYLHHGPGGRAYDDANAMGDALLAAAAEAGVRMTLLDTCYLHGGIGRPPNEVQQRFSDGDAERWAARAAAVAVGSSSAVRAGAAVHSVRAVAPEEMGIVAGWADERGAPLHAHVSEQPAENEDCTTAYGRTPVEVLAAAGLAGERFTAVHATHLSGTDVTALGSGHVCFCPTTERDLADGIGPAAALVAAGANLCLGSDSHAMIDLFEEARAVELDARLATGVRGHHAAADLLAAATSGGARALGWLDAGHLAVGALADLTVIGLDSVRMAGAAPGHLVEGAVFAAAAPDVRHVMVGGRWIVRDGEHVSVPVRTSLAEAIDAVWAAA